jgi:hypothetical protein
VNIGGKLKKKKKEKAAPDASRAKAALGEYALTHNDQVCVCVSVCVCVRGGGGATEREEENKQVEIGEKNGGKGTQQRDNGGL